MISVILFDKDRYSNSKGSRLFGERITVNTETREQAQEIADSLSYAHDAGLTDQFYIEDEVAH